MKKFSDGQIFVALDMSDKEATKEMAKKIAPYCSGLKIGLEFFTRFGPDAVKEVMNLAGKPLFLDLKFHDIPNTVASAIRSIMTLRPSLLTLHASGGFGMMQAAKEAAEEEASKLSILPPDLLAVTILTSLDTDDLRNIGYQHDAKGQVQRLADLSIRAGMNGLVCSGAELSMLRQQLGDEPILVVPGIRNADGQTEDQKRTMSPLEAKKTGADILVIGRPITKAMDPVAAATEIRLSLHKKV